MFIRRPAVIGVIVAVVIAAGAGVFALSGSKSAPAPTTSTTNATPGPVVHIDQALTTSAVNLARAAAQTALVAHRNVRASDITYAAKDVVKVLKITQNLGQNPNSPNTVVFVFHLIGAPKSITVCLNVPSAPNRGPTPVACP